MLLFFLLSNLDITGRVLNDHDFGAFDLFYVGEIVDESGCFS